MNFDLIVERTGENYRARVLDSPAGQAFTEFEIPFSELELENFVLRMGRPRAGVRRVESSEMEAVKGCGERLFRAVFKDDVYAAFLRSRDNALEEGQGLRVRLRIDVPEFHDYPWEYLYNAHLNQFLALSRETPVVRYLELPYPVQPLTVEPPLKILVMISSPEGFPKLEVEEEWNRLSSALVPLARRGLVMLERLKKPTLSALQQHLRRGEYHIFHFIGHGKYSEHKQDGMLLLEEEGGQGRPVSGQYLGTVLHDHRSLRLVVLNACEGARTSQEDPYAGVAQTLVLQGIPAVIAMQFEILETAAITFAQEFYGAVADGFPVDAAVSEARKAIFAAGNDVEWGTPVLYMRTPQGVIFEIPEAQRVKHALSEEPISYVDKELEQKLEGLYTEGLAAFWVEDWDKACDRFQKILGDRPDHAAAAAKLAEAKRQRQLSLLYARAVEAQQAGNWPLALQALEELQKDSPDYKDTSTTLKIVRKEKQLADLYAEAKKLHAAQKWQAVMKVFDQIHSIDPEYPDPETLLPSAEKELVELKRQAELKEFYSRAVRAMDAGQWEEAQKLLRQVQTKESGFLETERLLRKAEVEIRKAEEQQNQRDQINTLYEQAHGLLRSKKWRKALDKIEEIRELDDHFDDPEKIAERAQLELTREEQEAERQNELAAMYAEVVRLEREEKYQAALDKWQEIKKIDPKYPDRQKIQRTARKSLSILAKPVTQKRKIFISKSLWIWMGSIVTLVIVIGLIIAAIDRQKKAPPASSAPTSSVGGGAVVPIATKGPGEFMVTPLLDETCPIYSPETDIEGFISESDDPLAPWSGDSVHFKGTEVCIHREKLGEASLIYRYRLEFEEETLLTSVAVSGAAFNGPNSIFRVLDENMNVLGTVDTFGGNTFQTHLVTLENVKGKVFFIDEFDTSLGWRFRQSIVVNRPLVISPVMNLRVNYGNDWVEGFYEDGHLVWITVTEGDGTTLKAKAVLVTEPKEYWSGETGFNSMDSVWFDGQGNPLDSPPDIQSNDRVYGWIDNGASAQVQIGAISGMVDIKADSIEGTIMAPWITDPVRVECLDWGSGRVPEFRPIQNGSVRTDGLHSYSCSWNEWNIQPGQAVGVGYFDPDENWVAYSFVNEDFTVKDPTVYDDFDTPAVDGTYNTSLWNGNQSFGKIIQENGLLKLMGNGTQQTVWLDSSHQFKPENPMYVEAHMMLDQNTLELGSNIAVAFVSSDGQSICSIYADEKHQWISCWSEFFGIAQRHYDVIIDPGTWHSLRVELLPDTMTFNYVVDGQNIGSYIPKNADRIKNLRYVVQLHLNNWTEIAESPTGYIDYVRMGAIEDDPTIYDNFDNTSFDGKFDYSKWTYLEGHRNPDGNIYQENGVLVLSQSGTEERWHFLQATNLDFYPVSSAYFESALRLDPGAKGGDVQLGFHSEYGTALCGLEANRAYCWCNTGDDHLFDERVSVQSSSWQFYRVEVVQPKAEFTFYINGRNIGSCTLPTPTGSIESTAIFDIGNWMHSGNVRGYIDYIHIGPLE